MWVIKLGGSLAGSEALSGWLSVLACYGGGQVVIVPGGGPFATQVRTMQSRWQFDDETAHPMAVLAMEQYGLMMAGIRPDLVVASSDTRLREVLEQAGVAVWLPAAMVSGQPDIPMNWTVSSDSLAVWLAGRLQAERLVLVKRGGYRHGTVPVDSLVRKGVVDSAFPSFLARLPCSAWVLDSTQHEAMMPMLQTGAVTGTLVQSGAEARFPPPQEDRAVKH